MEELYSMRLINDYSFTLCAFLCLSQITFLYASIIIFKKMEVFIPFKSPPMQQSFVFDNGVRKTSLSFILFCALVPKQC